MVNRRMFRPSFADAKEHPPLVLSTLMVGPYRAKSPRPRKSPTRKTSIG